MGQGMDVGEMVKQGAVFYVSHSGGKDSQAMYNVLSGIIPYGQLVVVHSDLGEVEWTGVKEHIIANVKHPVNVVAAGKTLLGMVAQRKMWPSSSCRQCTSDLKRNPIMKFIRNDMKARGAKIAINCTGIRAVESTARAKKTPFEINKAETNGVRTMYNWMPIFNLSTYDVWENIREAGQKPFWAYEKNERLSCVFCIMGSLNDLRHGAEKNPILYKKYVDLEKQIGHTMFVKGKTAIPLELYTGIKAD